LHLFYEMLKKKHSINTIKKKNNYLKKTFQ